MPQEPDNNNNDENLNEFDEPVDFSAELQDDQQQPEQDKPEQDSAPESGKQELTADAIAEAVSKGMKASQPAQPKDEKPLSPEEVDKYLKRAKYSADDLKALGLVGDDDPAELVEKKVQHYAHMQRRIVQEAVAAAQIMLQHQQEQIGQQINPLMQAHVEQQTKQLKDEFYGTFPALKGYDQLVTMAAKELESEGQTQGKSKKDIFDLVAQKTAGYVKQFGNKDIDLKATQKSPATQGGGGVPSPANMGSSGGRSQQPGNQGGQKESLEFSIYED